MPDKLPPSPIDWEDIPLGPGQEPPRPNAHFQHTKDLPPDTRGSDVRRTPGYEHFVVVSRWPERPA